MGLQSLGPGFCAVTIFMTVIQHSHSQPGMDQYVVTSDNEVTYSDAMTYCNTQFGGTLAVVSDAQTHAVIFSVVQNSGSSGVWISGRRAADEVYYRTNANNIVSFIDWSDGSQFTPFWRTAMDEQKTNECLKMTDINVEPDQGLGFYGTMFNDNCSAIGPFVCQLFPEPPCRTPGDSCSGEIFSRDLQDYCFWDADGTGAGLIDLTSYENPDISPSDTDYHSTLQVARYTAKLKDVGFLFKMAKDMIEDTSEIKCHMRGGNLLNVHNEQEYQHFLTEKILVEGRPYKYGLRSTPSNDVFRWDNGWVLTWARWARYAGNRRFKRDLNAQSDEAKTRDKRNVPSPYALYPSAPATFILYDLGAGLPTVKDHFYHMNPSGTIPVGNGNWVIAPDGTFPTLIVCEATKEAYCGFNAPELRNAKKTLPSNDTITYVCKKGFAFENGENQVSVKCFCDAWNISQQILPYTAGCNCVRHSKMDPTTCECVEGYEWSNNLVSCVDVDECKISPCHHLCENVEGNFVCLCHNGYQTDPYNTKFCVDVDECAGDFQCGGHYECLNIPGSYRCECPRGFQQDGSGVCQGQGTPSSPTTLRIVLTFNEQYKDDFDDESSLVFKAFVESIWVMFFSQIETIVRLEGHVITLSRGSVVATVSMMLPNDADLDLINLILQNIWTRITSLDIQLNHDGRNIPLINRVEFDAGFISGYFDLSDACSILTALRYCIESTCNTLNGSPHCECTRGYYGARCDLYRHRETLFNPLTITLLVFTCTFTFLFVLLGVCLCLRPKEQTLPASHVMTLNMKPLSTYNVGPTHFQLPVRRPAVETWDWNVC